MQQPGLAPATTDFYPRPPRGGRPPYCRRSDASCRFLSTPSARRATDAGESGVALGEKFLSTPSARRATHAAPAEHAENQISIHALREEGDPEHWAICCQRHLISIHALREEGDTPPFFLYL